MFDTAESLLLECVLLLLQQRQLTIARGKCTPGMKRCSVRRLCGLEVTMVYPHFFVSGVLSLAYTVRCIGVETYSGASICQCFWLQDNGKDDIEGHDANEHEDISEDEGETIEIKRHSGGKDRSDVDYPSDTLKHYRRASKSFLKTNSQGTFLDASLVLRKSL